MAPVVDRSAVDQSVDGFDTHTEGAPTETYPREYTELSGDASERLARTSAKDRQILADAVGLLGGFDDPPLRRPVDVLGQHEYREGVLHLQPPQPVRHKERSLRPLMRGERCVGPRPDARSLLILRGARIQLGAELVGDLRAEMLGHTSSDITKEHYIEHDDKVNPVTTEILEALTPKENRDAA